ncbi:hypothetical protein U3516DRAFT_828859 [Neocallimastix sp. 'constans']
MNNYDFYSYFKYPNINNYNTSSSSINYKLPLSSNKIGINKSFIRNGSISENGPSFIDLNEVSHSCSISSIINISALSDIQNEEKLKEKDQVKKHKKHKKLASDDFDTLLNKIEQVVLKDDDDISIRSVINSNNYSISEIPSFDEKSEKSQVLEADKSSSFGKDCYKELNKKEENEKIIYDSNGPNNTKRILQERNLIMSPTAINQNNIYKQAKIKSNYEDKFKTTDKRISFSDSASENLIYQNSNIKNNAHCNLNNKINSDENRSSYSAVDSFIINNIPKIEYNTFIDDTDETMFEKLYVPIIEKYIDSPQSLQEIKIKDSINNSNINELKENEILTNESFNSINCNNNTTTMSMNKSKNELSDTHPNNLLLNNLTDLSYSDFSFDSKNYLLNYGLIDKKDEI